MSVGLSPPVAVMFPFRVADVDVMSVALLKVIVGGATKTLKLKEASGHDVPAVFVAFAVK